MVVHLYNTSLTARYGLLACIGCLVGQHITSATDRPSGTDPSCDLLVYGATPGGVACAVRAAREGLDVQLVTHAEHLGGMFTNGLSTMDTLYHGARSPIYDELREAIYNFYRRRYGPDSPQLEATQPGHPKTRYEAHVIETLINQLLSREMRITILKNYYPVAAERADSRLQSVTFRKMDGGAERTLAADIFADCSYEADLAAVAGVACRVGRESRDEFDEEHAGVIFMRSVPWPPPNADPDMLAISRGLNLFRYDEWFERIAGASTGTAHPSVQGFNMRTVVTSDPDNRVAIEKPPGYRRESFEPFGAGDPDHPGLSMPNRKFGLNEPKLVGQQDPYVEGDWETRREVTRRHREATLGLLYFRQHDPSIPAPLRQKWQALGLPKDEFAGNGHMPYAIYVRESRRIKGRAIFTENDAGLAPGLKRAPIHPDSISVTEWFLDSHGCTPRRVAGSEWEGKVMLKNQTFPGQVSFNTILPREFDNLVVPVCLSATHVGWGTIRLEPTWMSISEAAALAVVLAEERGVTLPRIDVQDLVFRLAERRFLLAFFNDIEGHEKAPWYPAVQILGTLGYFGSYDARPLEPLTVHLADTWVESFRRQTRGIDETPSTTARLSLAADQQPGPTIAADEFARRLAAAMAGAAATDADEPDILARLDITPDAPIRRGDACRLIVEAMHGAISADTPSAGGR